MTADQAPRRPTRRLALILGGTGLLIAVGTCSSQFAEKQDAGPAPWFGGYADVTTSPPYSFDVERSRNVLLAFVVADPQTGCTPQWGSVHSLKEAALQVNLDARLAGFRADGGSVGVSFGGAINQELATVCSDEVQLAAAYRRVIDRYDVSTVDLDVEGPALLNHEAGLRRARVFAALQEERRESGESLHIWLTVPVLPTGLTEDGQIAVQQMLDSGVDLAGTNIMTMNYGASRQSGEGMLEASIQAAQLTHSQLRRIYRQAGEDLDGAELWRKIGLTPMIGRNEVQGDTFTLADARALNEFAAESGVGRISMWSLNRDNPCTQFEAESDDPSPNCSGTGGGPGVFAEALKRNFSGAME